jgi:hypothetical protein
LCELLWLGGRTDNTHLSSREFVINCEEGSARRRRYCMPVGFGAKSAVVSTVSDLPPVKITSATNVSVLKFGLSQSLDAARQEYEDAGKAFDQERKTFVETED